MILLILIRFKPQSSRQMGRRKSKANGATPSVLSTNPTSTSRTLGKLDTMRFSRF